MSQNLRRIEIAGLDDRVAPGARSRDVGVEAGVLFLIAELIRGLIAPDLVAVDGARAVLVIEPHIVQRCTIRPDKPRNPGDDVGQIALRLDIEDAQGKGFRAGFIDRIAKEPVVGTVFIGTEGEIGLSRREYRSVHEHLLRTAVARAPHQLWMLGAGLVAAPIGIGAVDRRDAGIELLDPALHFFNQLYLQLRERCENGIGILIFGVNIGADLGAKPG